ncbi:hypothetical protein N7478_003718 [Penicillium angulare]|uniref:uncharacterized protein n=1 Tax=Penicillium angulare TaxID=116970 RepID=UPI00253FDA65|nr:uncharacterized protein N7478_003718 [Penicillium angulare]KAJ5288032.1 hypothetical protein N7478_003718 [Penicillium angulare]
MASHIIFGPNNSGVQIGNLNGMANFHIHERPSQATLNHQCLRDLGVTNPKDDKARIESFKGGLLKESYRWILSNPEFIQWQQACGVDKEGGHEDNRPLWIKADPGKGKTMLLCGIIDELQAISADDVALSFFFCQTDEPELRSAAETAVSCARSMGSRREIFGGKNSWEALSEILFDIMKDDNLQRVVFILDALDECTSGRSQLIDFVRRSSINQKVRWIVSSRDWPEIEEQLLMSRCLVLSLEMNQESIGIAVDAFIRSKVDLLAKQKSYDLHTQDIVESYLTSNSSETFLWVALVCDQLMETSSWRVEEKLATFPPSLTHFYQRMIEKINRSEEAKLCKELLSTLSTVFRPLTLDELPTFVTLPSRSSRNHQILMHIVKLCGSFLSIRGDKVLWIHQSAREFLLDNRSLYSSEIKNEHQRILHACLKLIKRTLRQDIYHLKHPASDYVHSFKEFTSPTPDPLASVRYASIYWIDHLLGCDLMIESLAIASFLSEKFLHWVEALCLLRCTWRGFEMMRKLESLLQVSVLSSSLSPLQTFEWLRTPSIWLRRQLYYSLGTPSFQVLGPSHTACHSTELSRFVTDACLFIQLHREAIERYPLQIYSSCLIFSPDNNIVKLKLYEKERASWLIKPPIIRHTWNSSTHTIETSGGSILALSWSQDGKHMMYVTGSSFLKTFDTNTGHCISSVFLHQIESALRYRCMAWSFDKSRIAFLAPDKLTVWSCHTGKCLQSITVDDGNRHIPSSISWSKDGEQLATLQYHYDDDDDDDDYGPTYSRLMVFDLFESQHAHPQSFELPELPEQTLERVFWSQYHDWLVLIGSGDPPAVKIWDTNAGALVKSIELENQFVALRGENVAYFESPDSQLLATTTEDGWVHLWDLVDGEALSAFETTGVEIPVIEWSPDGGQLAVASSEGMDLGIRDPRTGELLCLFEVEESVSQICWSPDKKRFASSSSEPLINIWEPDFFKSSSLSDISDSVYEILWSPDDIHLATVHETAVHIWNVVTDKLVSSFKGIFFSGHAVSWSPDGCLIAIASRNGTIKICLADSGQLVYELHVGHHDRLEFQSMAWSNSGSHVVSVSAHCDFRTSYLTVRGWNLAAAGEQYIEIRQEASQEFGSRLGYPKDLQIMSSRFPSGWSIDDHKVAFACVERILIFDPATGIITQTLQHGRNHDWPVLSIAWSPLENQLASASETFITIWNPVTGECLKRLDFGAPFIQFDRMSPNILKTPWGTINLGAMEHGYQEKEVESSAEKSGPRGTVRGYGLLSDHCNWSTWISWNGDPLLWLPIKCRPPDYQIDRCFDISGGRVTIGSDSGQVLVFWLAPDPTSFVPLAHQGSVERRVT